VIDPEEILSALVRRGAMSPIAAKCAREQLAATAGTPDEAFIRQLLEEIHEGLLSHVLHHD